LRYKESSKVEQKLTHMALGFVVSLILFAAVSIMKIDEDL